MRPSTTSASISVQGPWQITPTGLPASKKSRTNCDRLRVGAQVVGVGDAAGQHEAVEVVRLGVADGAVRREGLALVEVVEGLHVARFGGEQLGLGAGRLDRLARLGQLDFLDPLVGGEEGDFLAVQLV